MGIQFSESSYVYIPKTITVHLGPPDSTAENVTLPFIDYIKNVASSELYPTWPEDALKANINAIVSIAPNRVFTEWYRSKGYNFDITSTTQFDQAFVPNRELFDNISQIVDETFDDYIVRGVRVEPLFAEFCDGKVSQCDGMYQWGSVDLANHGYTPIEILKYYYGEDINLVTNTPIKVAAESYPGTPLSLGDSGIPIYYAQLRLNNISTNFPAIPKIFPVDGIFSTQTESAVKSFQKIFNLPSTGVIDKGTWYKILYIHTAVRKLAESTSSGILLSERPRTGNGIIVPRVQIVQYYLNILSAYYRTIPAVEITGVLDLATNKSIIEF
ncbi:MAG: peptidoglycan-binding protein [Sedimentibacter sp.]|uniref:peptidoglycan-binding protein n=1 Tax=Sedimentibacter sp. TaxID=1960295 RepID=UPI002980ECC3|nr:peptidoglycan-binding protein [Sedimentibacter sp.]MDW5299673.1 peptidoglycan-binding protein [Sedimentibacter sp.]